MAPAEWPLRLIPTVRPPWWASALVTVSAIAASVALRALLTGTSNSLGLSSFHFPALIVISLYAGGRWGFAALAVLVAAGFGAPRITTLAPITLTLMFALSGALTVMVGAALRTTLVRLRMEQDERERVEGRMQESEARFRALADSAPVLMWVTDRDDRREFINLAYCEFMGLDYQAALALDWRARIDPVDLQRVRQDEAVAEAAGELVVLEARYQRGDGGWRWLRSISRPRIDADGRRNGFIGIALDISDAKQAEADLKRINELLEERIDEALTERDRAQEALARAQRLESLGQLTGGVAHDFNNLLTVVIGALDMIARHPGDAARRGRMVEAALSAAHRGERLTQQLLAFARRQPLKTERLEVDALLRESESLLSRAVGEAIDFKVAPGAPGLHARVDPVQLEAALMNLAVNARDAVGERGGIRIETRRCAVSEGEVEETEAGDYICIAVHDTGVGMDAETQARVFEPFFTTKPVGKGTGLGLSQVYGFARQSGGGARIESSPGKGSTIRLYLPVDEVAEEPRLEAATPVADEADDALDVLLVEDDSEVAELVSEMLKDLGHRVRHAPDAHAALEMLEAALPVGLLLTDVIMPGGKNGVELAREATSRRPGLPVILSSGYSGDALGPAEQAPWPLLRKPYTRDSLTALIKRVTSET